MPTDGEGNALSRRDLLRRPAPGRQGPTRTIDSETAEMLKSLGYLD